MAAFGLESSVFAVPSLYASDLWVSPYRSIYPTPPGKPHGRGVRKTSTEPDAGSKIAPLGDRDHAVMGD